MKVKKSVVFAAALACGILLAVPLGAAAASNYRMAENGRQPRGKCTAEPYCFCI